MNVYKVVFIDAKDRKGRMKSVMKVRPRFYINAHEPHKVLFRRAVEYKVGHKTVPCKDSYPYLFAFSNLSDAKEFARGFISSCPDGQRIALKGVKGHAGIDIKAGFIEIWKAEAEIHKMPELDEQLEIGQGFRDVYVQFNAPKGTVFCDSITLTERVNL